MFPFQAENEPIQLDKKSKFCESKKQNDCLVSAVLRFLEWRADSLITVFDEFSENCEGTPVIRAHRLKDALSDIYRRAERDISVERMPIADCHESGGLNLQEFRRAVELSWQPTQLELWASMLPLSTILAKSLPVYDVKGDKPLRDVSTLSDDAIDAAVDAFSQGLKKLLPTERDVLKKMFDSAEVKASEEASEEASDLTVGVSVVSKFKTYRMNTGTVDDFFHGLSSKIGTRFTNFSAA
jgi:hypothetical protein